MAIDPFAVNPELKPGILDRTHESNVTVVWTKGSLPTPWPWLVVSYTMTLMFALIGLVTLARTRYRQHAISRGRPGSVRNPLSNRELLIYQVTAGYHTLRTLLLLGIAASHATGHMTTTAPATAFFMMASTSPYFSNPILPRIIMTVFAVDTLLLYLATLLLNQVISSRGGGINFSHLELAGGNCPFVSPAQPLWYCAQSAREDWNHVGCPPYPPGNSSYFPSFGANISGLYDDKALNDDKNLNVAKNVEQLVSDGALYLGAFIAFFALVMLLLSGPWNIKKRWEPCPRLGQKFPSAFTPHARQSNHGLLYFVRRLSLWLDVLAVVVFVVVLLMVYVILGFNIGQWRGPRMVTLIDSIGTAGPVKNPLWGPQDSGLSPPDNTNGTLNFTGGTETRWSDCFEAAVPSGKHGFMRAWWTEDLDAGKRFVHLVGFF